MASSRGWPAPKGLEVRIKIKFPVGTTHESPSLSLSLASLSPSSPSVLPCLFSLSLFPCTGPHSHIYTLSSSCWKQASVESVSKAAWLCLPSVRRMSFLRRLWRWQHGPYGGSLWDNPSASYGWPWLSMLCVAWVPSVLFMLCARKTG